MAGRCERITLVDIVRQLLDSQTLELPEFLGTKGHGGRRSSIAAVVGQGRGKSSENTYVIFTFQVNRSRHLHVCFVGTAAREIPAATTLREKDGKLDARPDEPPVAKLRDRLRASTRTPLCVQTDDGPANFPHINQPKRKHRPRGQLIFAQIQR